MSDYLHGAYGEWFANGNIPTAVGEGVVVAVGTAPVQNLSLKEGEDYNVNKPVLVRNIAEAKRLFGYSDDWAKYTLCEAMHHFFENKRVGPLVLINVLDPGNPAFTITQNHSETLTVPANYSVRLYDAHLIDVDTVASSTTGAIESMQVEKSIDAIIIHLKESAVTVGGDVTITCKKTVTTTEAKTPAKNMITIADAEEIVLEGLELQTIPESGDPETKVKGVDYVAAYNSERKTITITGITDLGTDPLNVIYYKVTHNTPTINSAVIGSSDDLGGNKGLYAVRDVYPLTGAVPAYLIAPGFGTETTIHETMYEVSQKVNGHWDMWMFVDLPIWVGTAGSKISTIAAWKTTNGYNKPTETVYWPMAEGVDGKKYHLSVLAAANFLELLTQYEGVPFHSASNTPAPIIKRLWIGSGEDSSKVYDDKIINEKLNANGIASAAYVGGRWAIWGAHAADYDQDNADYVNVAETNRMMLMYVSNNFQVRRSLDVDKPLTQNDIDSIVSEEQARLDGLKQMGALIFGEALLDAESIARSDVYSGDFVFAFRVTTTPLAKSLTAVVTWVDDGFSTYFAEA